MGTLEAIADALWLVDGPNVDFHGFPYPTRMVIARLPDSSLWVWSPIALTPELRAEVERLGRVAHLVSPNKLHHLSLGDWHATYPEARLWGPPSTIAKRPDLPFEPALGDEAPAAWLRQFDSFPMRGSPLLDEWVFFHRPSRTAIFADLTEHFSRRFLHAHWAGWQRWIARRWGIVEGVGRAPLEWRASWLHRADARRQIRRLIALSPERVVMAHGAWIRHGGAAFIARAFDWLLG